MARWLQLLRSRYFLFAWLLLALTALGMAGVRWVAIVATVLLVLLTINWIVPRLRR